MKKRNQGRRKDKRKREIRKFRLIFVWEFVIDKENKIISL